MGFGLVAQFCQPGTSPCRRRDFQGSTVFSLEEEGEQVSYLVVVVKESFSLLDRSRKVSMEALIRSVHLFAYIY